ncbi:hypothetical protein RUND412_011597, partial [Rhizina undulata]
TPTAIAPTTIAPGVVLEVANNVEEEITHNIGNDIAEDLANAINEVEEAPQTTAILL